jgi:hypothetical protein
MEEAQLSILLSEPVAVPCVELSEVLVPTVWDRRGEVGPVLSLERE